MTLFDGKIFIDAVTGEETRLELTPEEREIRAAEEERLTTEAGELLQKAANKTILLEKLGINEDEARLLLS